MPYGRYSGILVAALVTAALAPPRAAGADPDPAQIEFFESKVRPILADRCFGCHGPEKQKGGLRLDSPGAMRAGGDSGPAVEPGDPSESLLIEAVRYDGLVQMPPDGKLPEPEFAALKKWVEMGAPWPGSPLTAESPAAAPATPAGDPAFWSFQPIADPPVPAVSDPPWPRTPIDAFILGRLEQAGLRPSPPADKRTLIRRATFDLTGLPPTPGEVEAFVADDSPEAFARVVDRLLASPAYGERWARHWLDVARYAEDQAHSFKPRLYPEGFRYRDWIVRALNSDMPYGRFLAEQIAGDLLDDPGRMERLPALGFLACGPVYYGDPKKFDQFDDRIDTLSRGLLGLTVACARCHDHKYDPIPQADYYALAGVIASTDYHEAPLAPPEVVAAYDRAQEAIKGQETGIDKFLAGEAKRLTAERAGETARYLVAAWKARGRGGPDAAEAVAKGEGLATPRLKRWLAYLDDPKAREHPLWSRWRSAADAPAEADALNAVEAAAREAEANVLALLGRRAEAGAAKDEAAADEPKLSDDEKAFLDALTGDKGPLNVPKNKVEEALNDDGKATLAAMRSGLERLKAAAPPKFPIAHALKDAQPVELAVLARGNPDAPGAKVERQFLSVLGGTRLANGSGRLDLARAITCDDNPLTPRVVVNRLWQHHFGRGLVGTASNFGALGERPSHPELLDWLARRFLDSGGSWKAMHRLILLSATYQQASRPDPRALEADPENRLLWRMAPRRLEVEPWRDALLAVSGRLDRTVGGPPFALDDNPAPRRTLYASISRHNLAPLLRLFDFPDPNITSAGRTRTTVPLQQLVVLNDDLLIESARALAARVGAEVGDDPAARIDRAYRITFGRPPTASEAETGRAFLSGPEDDGGLSRWERYTQALLMSNEFTFLD